MSEEHPGLDVLRAPLGATTLVEASAGTGKTYTITGLFVRMICEGHAAIEQMLVVTYTRAATAELRDRIRQGLTRALEAFQQGGSADPLLQALVDQCGDRDRAVLRLAAAVAGFDGVAIYTIHGFCQRVLADHAFESALPFDVEMVVDDRELLLEVVQDFWRARVYPAPERVVEDLLRRGASPESLAAWVGRHVEKPFLQVQAPEAVDLSALAAVFDTAFAATRRAWPGAREEVRGLLIGNPALNGNRYRAGSVGKWLAGLEAYLELERGGLEALQALEKFGSRALTEGTRKNKQPPEHPFFAAIEGLEQRRQALVEGLDQHFRGLLAALLDAANRELAERKAALRQQSFGDLLLRLAEALQGPEGEALAASLRDRYRVALIDEFQDTDPVQFGIFDRIYRDSGLTAYLVGDPKQAIYSFRGADVFAYLQGRARARHRFTLRDNWRSSPLLIRAVNALFSANPAPFLLADIPFVEATPAPRERPGLRWRGGEQAAPLQIWRVDADAAGKPQGKGAIGELAAAATASEIARLLNDGANRRALIGERPLGGGDIAVLVRSHREAQLVRRELSARGIPCVEQSQESVFHCVDALYLERLLQALIEPGAEGRVRAALCADWFEVSGDELARFEVDESLREHWLLAFHDWHGLWRERGFIAALRHILEGQGVAARLLAAADGDRRLTNLRHLLELLQAAAGGVGGMEGLVQWLGEQRQGGAGRGEEAQLRLESDEQLVQIVTIHRSKGLQYPVVFCPFTWDGKFWCDRDTGHAIHDPRRGMVPVLELRPSEEALEQARREELAENLRLLYVALTRAEYRCYLVWGNIKDAGSSALGWLLHGAAGDTADPEALREGLSRLGDDGLGARLEALRSAAGGCVAVSPLAEQVDQGVYGGAKDASQALVPRVFPGLARAPWRVTSYSALAQGARVGGVRDHDALGRRAPAVEVRAPDIHQFPRGARPGHCLHALFERLDFTGRDEPGTQRLIAECLRSFGFEQSWGPVLLAMVRRVLAAPLDLEGKVLLQEVAAEQRVVELEFYYPIADISPEGLGRACGLAGPARELTGGRLQFTPVRGYLRGFIDLVLEAHGRYYLLDYKSNWLGPATEDYARPALDAAMAEGNYHLQYLLYTVALHRYLRLRLPGYDYERHFGGVCYLFLRGIDPERSPHTGIFRARPERRRVEALDHYLSHGAAEGGAGDV